MKYVWTVTKELHLVLDYLNENTVSPIKDIEAELFLNLKQTTVLKYKQTSHFMSNWCTQEDKQDKRMEVRSIFKSYLQCLQLYYFGQLF